MRRLWTALALGLLLARPWPAPASPSRADAHLRTAEQLLRRGREKDARMELKAALSLEPGRDDIRELLEDLDSGAAALPASPAPGSAQAAAEALAAKVEPLLARARSAYHDSELKAAAAAWAEVLRLDPAQPEAQEGLRRLEQEAYRPDAAAPFDRAVADLYESGMREMRKGRLVEARRKLDEARALNPVQPQLLRALALVAEGAQDQQRGRDAQGLVLQGQRHLAEGEDAKAVKAFKAALGASPGLQAAQAGLDEIRQRNGAKVEEAAAQGQAALRRGDWTAAGRSFRLALGLDPEHAAARQGLAELQALQKGRRNAAALRREADRLYNSGVEAWQAGDLALAAARFRDCLAVAPGDAEAAKALAAVHRRLDERAAKDRGDAQRLLQEGRTLEGRGALEEALRRYERALARDPSLAEAAEAKAGLEKRLKGL